MQIKAENEIWQLKAGEEVYEADLPTLKQWIGEGLVQPTDMVRKGSLKWIEAGRVPGLRRVFTGEEQPSAAEQADAPDAAGAPPAAAASNAPAAAGQRPGGANGGSRGSAGATPGGAQRGGPPPPGAPSLSSSCP